jgi:hypothetical protein
MVMGGVWRQNIDSRDLGCKISGMNRLRGFVEMEKAAQGAALFDELLIPM